MNRVRVLVRRGCVVSVEADEPEGLEVIVVDYDTSEIFGVSYKEPGGDPYEVVLHGQPEPWDATNTDGVDNTPIPEDEEGVSG